MMISVLKVPRNLKCNLAAACPHLISVSPRGLKRQTLGLQREIAPEAVQGESLLRWSKRRRQVIEVLKC